MSANRHTILKQLAGIEKMDDFYLAGGTALALQFGHRLSEDLDFFSQKKINPLRLISMLSEVGRFQITGQDEGTLHGLLNDVKVSFLYYPYIMLEDFQQYHGIKIASALDISMMKLIALVQRGTKKDFFDLYFIEKKVMKIEGLIEKITEKYYVFYYEPLLIFKSIGYFEDAEMEPDPIMLNDISWEDVKSYFTRRQIELLRYCGGEEVD